MKWKGRTLIGRSWNRAVKQRLRRAQPAGATGVYMDVGFAIRMSGCTPAYQQSKTRKG